ncbi:hypothetical protein CJU89_5437 [Yarrowia sp. B02]|nr:hypothetical protein CJU89_5437 [Yarrowia sp. B02]
MKRNLEEYTAGPLDEDTGQRSAFPLEEVGDLDLDGTPTDVAQYLAQVKREANQSPAFTTVGGQRRAANPSAYSKQYTDMSAVKPLSVVNEWRVEIRKSFMELRKTVQAHGDERPELPADVELPSTFSKWKTFISGSTAPEPTLQFIASLPHQQLFMLLEYCHKWLGPKISRGLSIWLTGLLACLPDILDASEQASVRNLGKRALEILQNPKYNRLTDVTVFALKSVVIISADVFHQHDLVETAPIIERERPVQVNEIVLDY